MITEKESRLRKQRMIDSAYTLFCKNGINATTMTQIAHLAKVSEISLYRYFGTKSALLSETQSILWKNIVSQIDASTIEKSDYKEKNGLLQFKMLLGGFRELYEKHSDYLTFSSSYKSELLRGEVKTLTSAYNAMIQPVLTSFIQAIDKGKGDGSINVPEDSAAVAKAVWCVMRSYVEHLAIFRATSDDIGIFEESFKTICSLLVLSLQSPNGKMPI